jgi:hypothetical protein
MQLLVAPADATPWGSGSSREDDATPCGSGSSREDDATPWGSGSSREDDVTPWGSGSSRKDDATPWGSGSVSLGLPLFSLYFFFISIYLTPYQDKIAITFLVMWKYAFLHC